VGRLEESPDVAGEVALEAADGFAGGLAFRLAPRDVVARLGVAAGAGDDHAVQRGVDLAVAAVVEALSPGVARSGGDRRDPGSASELGRCGKPLRAGDLADELGRGEGPEPGLGEQLRSDLGDRGGDLGSSVLIVWESSRIPTGSAEPKLPAAASLTPVGPSTPCRGRGSFPAWGDRGPR
jgi:hypothetical protein